MANRALPAGFLDLRTRALQALLGEAPLFVWMTDVEGALLWVNPALLAYLGRSQDDPLDDVRSDGTHPDDLARAQEALQRAVAARARFELEFRARAADGTWRWVLSRGVPYQDAAGRFAGIVGFIVDVHRGHEGEEQFRVARVQRQRFLDRMHTPVCAVGPDTCVRFVNRAFERTFALAREHLLGRPARGVLPGAVAEVLLGPDGGSDDGRVLTLATATGPRRALLQRLALVDPGDGEPILYGLLEGLTVDAEAEAPSRAPAPARAGAGGLAAGGAADLDRLLADVLAQADAALAALPGSGPATDALGRITVAAGGAAQLARRLLVYAGNAFARRQRLELSGMFDRLRDRLTAVARRAALEFDLAPGLPVVVADPVQVEQMVANLVANADEAMPAGGTIRVRTGAEMLTAERLAAPGLHGDCAPGEFVFVEVADDGPGMDDEVSARALEPFFSTRQGARGLGLPVVLGTARASGGAVSLATGPGRGCTVRIYLPAATD